MDCYIKVLKRYFQLQGRANRSEFWFFLYVHVQVNAFYGVVMFLILGYFGFTLKDHITPWIYMAYIIVTFPPLFAVSTRRFHDIGKSILWPLFMFAGFFLMPLIFFWYLFLMFRAGEPHKNKYGDVSTECVAENNDSGS